MVALLVFIMATLEKKMFDEKGSFDGSTVSARLNRFLGHGTFRPSRDWTPVRSCRVESAPESHSEEGHEIR